MEHCLITSREKTYEKKFWDPKLDQKLRFLPFSQDCNFGQCLTPIRVEISKKKFVAQIGAKVIFSILISSSVHSNLLVLLQESIMTQNRKYYVIKQVNLILSEESNKTLTAFHGCEPLGYSKCDKICDTDSYNKQTREGTNF